MVVQFGTVIVSGGGKMFTPAKMLIMMGRWFKNLISGGNFDSTSDWALVGGTITVSGNVGTITGNGVSANPRATKVTNLVASTGKVIVAFLTARVTNANCTEMEIYVQGTTSGSVTIKTILNPVQNQWYSFTVVWATTSAIVGNYKFTIGHQYADAATANGKVMEAKKISAHDLTTEGLADKNGVWCDANIAPFIIW